MKEKGWGLPNDPLLVPGVDPAIPYFAQTIRIKGTLG